MRELTPAQVRAALLNLKRWTKSSATIQRTYRFKDFAASLRFVNRVAQAAEAANHHPNIDIRWNQVTLALTTHSAGGLTSNDFALARRCDALAAG